MKDEPNERLEPDEEEAGERDLKYGEAFGTQRDRSSTQEDDYLDPESGVAEDEPEDRREGRRDLRYGEAFGTQRDRSKQEGDGYLDPEFGSREFTAPGDNRPPGEEETDAEE